MRLTVAFAAFALAASAAFAAGTGHTHDDEFAFGQPGDPAKAKRTIEIAMGETADGAMIFEPRDITVKRGETVRLKLVNKGEMDHELVLATREENDKHALEMMKNPDMEHDDPNGRRLAPGARDEIVWHFDKAGTFDFACLIPGHRDAGMHGSVVVD
ncbi:cupredoxin domain-containing protein [Methylobrevis pamukkalensis]|uniref:Plastocyanin n=1 Tax=Methylobrevis pamukkalensis TaxID=1439726 RepID=A0A1E3H580_9HYPH|nr:cupredoxin family protein [Methylobrevis pamukkalensis]ODN71460.1 Plastocyanin precursor [Methylobrevis pamukkalensis]